MVFEIIKQRVCSFAPFPIVITLLNIFLDHMYELTSTKSGAKGSSGKGMLIGAVEGLKATAFGLRGIFVGLQSKNIDNQG